MRPAARDVTLMDGTNVTLRAIEAGDAQRERDFIRGLSARSGYQRAFRPLRDVSAEDIEKLTQVDFARDAALVAAHRNENGIEEIVGVARYVREKKPDCAEFAIIVTDEWQQRGLGRLLLEALFDVARAHGLHRLHGLVLRSNRDMLDFAKEAGFTMASVKEDPTVMSAMKDL